MAELPFPAPRPRPAPREAMTVSELTATLRTVVEDRFPDVWVKGEISNCKRQSSGHVYFSLKDAESQLKAALFRSTARFLRFEPRDGIQVVVRGAVTVYPPRGEYQIQVQYMEPVGHGALHMAFEQLKEKLRAEGLFEESRKRPLPLLPRRLGIVTSPTGAAIRDILRVLERRYFALEIAIYPARVQGEGADREVVEGLRALGRLGGFDVIIVARGGGSMEDLWTFNEETVARAIAASRIPVISAVGHETDWTIADMVADVRAPTPSAAAEMVVRSKDELERRHAGLRERLGRVVRSAILVGRARLAGLATHRGLDRPRALLAGRRQLVDDLAGRAELAVRERAAALGRRRDAAGHRLVAADPRRRLELRRERLHGLRARLDAAAATRAPHRRGSVVRLKERLGRAGGTLLAPRRRRVQELASSLSHLSPLGVLERGYAIVSAGPDPGAPVVRRAADVRPGQRLHVRLHEGALEVRVPGREERPPAAPRQPSLFPPSAPTEED